MRYFARFLLGLAILTWGSDIGRAQAVDPANDQVDRPVRYDGHQVVRTFLRSWEQVEQLRALDVRLLSDAEAPGVVDYLVPPGGLADLVVLGIPYTVLDDDIQRAIDAERQRLTAAGPASPRDSDWYLDYKTNDEIIAKLNTLVADRPDLCTLTNIGSTLFGQPIWALRISGPGEGKPAALFFSTQHAREWIVPMTTTWIAEHLVTEYDTDPRVHFLVDSVEFFIVPVVNVDGYVFSWSSDRLWRKNRRYIGVGGCYGVDPNRNWPTGWGGIGASPDPCNETYRGAEPFSEPCVQVMRDFCLANPQIVVAIDFHNFSQLIMSPWGYTSYLPPEEDHARFMALGKAMHDEVLAVHGMEYAYGPGYEMIYPVSGSSTDWMYEQFGWWAFTVEVRDTGFYGFLLPPEQIIPTCEENYPAALILVENGIGVHDCNGNGVEDGADIAAGTSTDCNFNGIPDECEIGWDQDCNDNGVADLCDIGVGTSFDCNGNFIPDECDVGAGTSPDCNLNGVPDECEVGGLVDCNGNGRPDLCDIFDGTSVDCTGNGIPDECEPDCNGNGVADSCDIMDGIAVDCNENGVPDVCDLEDTLYLYPLDADPGWSTEGEWEFGQPTGDGGDEYGAFGPDPTSGYTGPNVYGTAINGNYTFELGGPWYLTVGPLDLSASGAVLLRFQRWLNIPFEPYGAATVEASNDRINWTRIWSIGSEYIPEVEWSLQEYDISHVAAGEPTVYVRWGYEVRDLLPFPLPCSGWNIDDIEIFGYAVSGDCNGNTIPDECDIAGGYSVDCNENGVPDDCDIDSGGSQDCNLNAIPDECDIASGFSVDCNDNGVPDDCDIATGTSTDFNSNGIPDDCEPDCNDNDIPDDWDLATGTSQDCNGNAVPDECDIDGGYSVDCNVNGIPDECDIAAGTSQDCNGNSTPDECDIASGLSADCNANGVPDTCDLAAGTSPDCNGNEIPDECDLADSVRVFASDVLTPLGGEPQVFTLERPADAVGEIALVFNAKGDLRYDNEYVTVDLNGEVLGTVYTGVYFRCEPDQIGTLTVAAETFNTLKAGGDATLTMTPSTAVSPLACDGDTYIQTTVTYLGVPVSRDTNTNGVPDECEACRGDADCNGVIDYVDIDYFVAAFSGGLPAWQTLYAAHHGGALPQCPLANCDVNGDNIVDAADIEPFIAVLGTACPQ